MKSNYKPIGNYIQLVDNRNKELKDLPLVGVTVNKKFIPSVANTIGTNMKNYKLIKKNQFACSLMQVRRDGKIPVALMQDDEAIISQAYPVFEIIDTNELLPEYLMMWMSRDEFDREACFYAVGGVRGSLEWEDFCAMQLPVPSPEKQKEIVKEYHTITDRIKLNEKLNHKLEHTAQSIYKEWFVNFEFPDQNGKPYKSNGGEMEYCDELDLEIPEGWNYGKMEDLGEVVGGATPSKDNPDYWDENGMIWITPKDLSKENYKFIYQGEFNISELGYKKSSTKLMPKNSVLFSSRAPIGYLAINMNEVCTNQGFKSIVPKKDIGSEFVYYYLKFNTENIANESTGSTFAEISGTMMKNYKALIPSKIACSKFSSIVNKIFNQQILMEKEIAIEKVLLRILLSKMATIEG
ncbi:MAG: restriction endonuclease subunit S [Campylobacterota bacterium]